MMMNTMELQVPMLIGQNYFLPNQMGKDVNLFCETFSYEKDTFYSKSNNLIL